jgi:hypothetical protein
MGDPMGPKAKVLNWANSTWPMPDPSKWARYRARLAGTVSRHLKE